MGNPEKKHQHYVPKFVLKNWATNKRVWVLNKYNGKIEERNFEDICFENYLYEVKDLSGGYITNNDFENGFMEYEDKMAPYFRTLIKKFDDDMTYRLTNEDCEKLLEFLWSMLTRHPRSLEYFENYSLDMLNDIDGKKINEIINSFDTLKEERGKAIQKLYALKLITPLNNKPGLLAESFLNKHKDGYCYILKSINNIFFASDEFCWSILLKDYGQVNYLPLSPTYCFIQCEKPIKGFDENGINEIDEIDEIGKDTYYTIFFIKSGRCNFIISDSKEKIENFKIDIDLKELFITTAKELGFDIEKATFEEISEFTQRLCGNKDFKKKARNIYLKNKSD